MSNLIKFKQVDGLVAALSSLSGSSATTGQLESLELQISGVSGSLSLVSGQNVVASGELHFEISLTGNTIESKLLATGIGLQNQINNLNGYTGQILALSGASGNFSLKSQTVFITGNQKISGDKSFRDNGDNPVLEIINGGAYLNADMTIAVTGATSQVRFGDGQLLFYNAAGGTLYSYMTKETLSFDSNKCQFSHLIGTTPFVFKENGNVTIDLAQKHLSGNWRHDAAPIFSYHLINKAYADENFFTWVDAPTTSTDTAQIGQLATTGGFLYVATGENLWGRIQIQNF